MTGPQKIEVLCNAAGKRFLPLIVLLPVLGIFPQAAEAPSNGQYSENEKCRYAFERNLIPDAHKVCQKAHEKNPADPNINLYLTILHWYGQDHASAFAQLNGAIKKMSAKPLQTYSHFREALQSWKKADRSRAIEFLTQAVQIDPSIPYLFFMRGHLYQLQYQEEILNKDSIKENKERDSIVHRKALEDFDRAILGNENFLPAYLYRAQMRIAVGDYTGALADAERLTRSDPNWHEALFIQGVSMNQLKPRSGCQLLMRSRALGHGLSGIRYMEDCARFNPPPLAEQVRGIAYTPMQTVCMDAWLCMTLPGNWNYRREEKAAEKKITFRALQMAPGLVHVVSVDIYQENTETFDSFFEKVRKTDFLKGETRDAAAFIPANLSNVSRSAYVTGKHPELSGNAGVFLAAVKDRPAFIKISIFRELIKTPQDVEFPAMEALFILMYEKFILDSIFVLPEIHSQILRERSTGL